MGGMGTTGPENHCSNESLSEYALKKDQCPGGLQSTRCQANHKGGRKKKGHRLRVNGGLGRYKRRDRSVFYLLQSPLGTKTLRGLWSLPARHPPDKEFRPTCCPSVLLPLTLGSTSLHLATALSIVRSTEAPLDCPRAGEPLRVQHNTFMNSGLRWPSGVTGKSLALVSACLDFNSLCITYNL